MALQEFGEWLTAEMASRRLSDRAFATYAGVSPAAVRTWRIGSSRPSWEVCAAIAKVLKVDAETVRDLVGYTEGEAEPLPQPTLEDRIRELAASAPWELPVQRDFAHAGDGDMTAQFVYLAPRPTKRSGLIALEVQGDCMEPEIAPGDVVIADSNISPQNGDVVVANVEGRAEVRRYQRLGDAVTLSADNSDSKPQALRVPSESEVWSVIEIHKRPSRKPARALRKTAEG